MPRKKTKARKKSTRKRKFSFKRFALKWMFIGGVWAVLAGCLVVAFYAYDLPDIDKLYEEYRTPNIRIQDNKGNEIATVGDLYGHYVPYKEFPQHLINAVISTEDRRFFSHFGIDPLGLLRAVVRNSNEGRVVQGGSTITQQLAKVVFLSPERKLRRKVQEMLLAFYLERKFSKQEILTMYLNRIYLGSGNYGVDAAAHSYFGKAVKDLNLFECATIAGLIKAPSRFSPSNNYELSQERADQVLRLMVDNDVLTTEEIVNGGTDENYKVARFNKASRFPYFVDWIKEQLPDYISNEQGDIIVRTTLDSSLQMMAEEAVRSRLAQEGKEHKVSQGAMVVMSPGGEVLAMVGGKSYRESQFNRATQALRQPGSAFKMFVYLAAMEKGWKPDDMMVDEKISIKGWKPKNYDKSHVGAVTLRTALANSINTIAIKLAREVGIGEVIRTAHKLGITSDIKADLTSALGTSEVNLLELTTAYAHLDNDGNAVWLHGITDIRTADGKKIYTRVDSDAHRVISPQAVDSMNNMLQAVVNYGTGKRAQMGRTVAGKTGTSQDARDAWFVGYTRDYVAGVWVGNDDNSPMQKVSGGGLPVVIWKDFMQAATHDTGRKAVPAAPVGVSTGGSLWDSIVRTFGGN